MNNHCKLWATGNGYNGWCRFDNSSCHEKTSKAPGVKCRKSQSIHELIRKHGLKITDFYLLPNKIEENS